MRPRSRATWPAPRSDAVRGLREVIDAGAEIILLNPTGETVAEDCEQMERLAADVIPQLSRLTAFAEKLALLSF